MRRHFNRLRRDLGREMSRGVPTVGNLIAYTSVVVSEYTALRW